MLVLTFLDAGGPPFQKVEKIWNGGRMVAISDRPSKATKDY